MSTARGNFVEPLEQRVLLSAGSLYEDATAAPGAALSLTGVSVDSRTYVDVRNYGATGDGVTDDRASIQAALNTGRPVYFPKTAAFYKVGNGLSYSGHLIASDGATIKASSTSFVLLTVSNVSGLYVGELNLEYPVAQTITTARPALYLQGVSDFTVDRMIIRKGGLIVQTSSNGVVRESQVFEASYNAFYVRSSASVTLKDNYSQTSVSAYAVEDATNVQILDNTGEDAYLGLRIEYSANALAEGNLFRYCREGATVYGPGSDSSIFTTDVTLRANTFYHCYKTVTINKVDAYVNHVGESALTSKMHVGNVLFHNNIVIGNDESTSLTNLSSNVVFNTGIGLNTRQVRTDTSGTSYYTMAPGVRYAYVAKSDGQMPVNWLFYVNFPTGVDLSAEGVLTMDVYWGNSMDENTLAVKLYSGLNRTGLICQIPLYQPYKYISLPVLMYVPDGVDASSVKSIEVARVGGAEGAAELAVSEIRKGLVSKAGYLHSYFHSELADGVQNAMLDSNVFVDVRYPYVNRKRIPANPPTIIEGTGKTGSTSQRPTNPQIGWRYYDTDLNNVVYWNGDDWIDVNTYWMDDRLSAAVNFDADDVMDLGNDPRTAIGNYTIEGWIKPADSGAGHRRIIERTQNAGGYYLELSSDNQLHGVQYVAGGVMADVHASFPHDNEFHHVAMTFAYNGVTSTARLYIDGQLRHTYAIAGAPIFPSQDTTIQSGDGFSGAIDRMTFHPRALSGAEIRSNMHVNGPLIVSTPGVSVVAGRAYEYDDDARAVAAGDGPIVWSKLFGPEGMSINPDTGDISWSPLEPGNYIVGIAASDGRDTANQVWTVLVLPPLPGDFNDDRAVNASDINLLVARIMGNAQDARYDLNADAVVDSGDLQHLVEVILDTHFGDADLDGDVDLNDLGTLSTYYGASPRGWEQGNFDADSDVDLNDLGILATNYGMARASLTTAAQILSPAPSASGPSASAAEPPSSGHQKRVRRRPGSEILSWGRKIFRQPPPLGIRRSEDRFGTENSRFSDVRPFALVRSEEYDDTGEAKYFA